MPASILHRFFYSFLGNALRALLTFVTGILLARGLGPENYGVFGFLMASFTAMTQLLEMGTANAFFTFISRKIRSKGFYFYYVGWHVIQFLLLLFVISVLLPRSYTDYIWQGESLNRVLIAFVAVFLQHKTWQMIAHIGESQRLTHIIQIVSVFVALIHFLVVLYLVLSDSISIEAVFVFISIEFGIASLLAIYIMPLKFCEKKESFSSVFKDYKHYCLPLIPTAWVAVIAAFADTWILQRFGGATEQGYYAIAMQFSAVSLIATRSILSILWKEVSEAYSENNLKLVVALFKRVTRIMFHIAALISCFLVPWTQEIIELTLGPEFLAGALAMMIMFFYPIDQARGQIAGTMLLSMAKTRMVLLIGVGSNFLGLLATYILVASPDASFISGYGLGSVGLALKMIIVQFITVNFSIWCISRQLNTLTDWAYQFISISVFVSLGFISKYVVMDVLDMGAVSVLACVIISGLIYLFSCLIYLFVCPSLVGLNRKLVTDFLSHRDKN